MHDPLVETAVRAFTLRDPHRFSDHDDDDEAADQDDDDQRRRSEPPLRRYAHEALIFDTETLVTPEQRLLFLTYRLYSTDPGGEQQCIDEGVVYPDDLPTRDPEGYTILADWAAVTTSAAVAGISRPDGGTVRLVPLSWWLDQRLHVYGHDHRDHCDVVGFNLLFDFGRVAQHWADATGDFYGGWWLGFLRDPEVHDEWKNRYWGPRLRVKALDPRRARYRWSSPYDKQDAWRGSAARIVDLKTLGYALTDTEHTLQSACAEFDVVLPSTGEAFTKDDVELGVISPDLLSYARRDVEASAELYFACLAELDQHPGVELDAPFLFSPASIGAKYLEAMGIRRPLSAFTSIDPVQLGGKRQSRKKRREPLPSPFEGDVGPDVLGWAMAAFYGGRAEARVVRTPVAVTLVDFTSMYPGVNALLDTRSLLTAEHLTVEDATSEARELLEADDLVERLFDPVTWRDGIGVTLVEVEPGGAVLPVRARYDPESEDYGIGVNPYTLDATTWYALPDLLASRLLGETRGLRIVRAVRVRGQGQHSDLSSVRLRGDAILDPRKRDPFLGLVEERHRILQDPTLDKGEQEWRERFLKVTANATSYGILARFDRREHATEQPVTVYGPDAEPVSARVAAPEDPGPYCFPPVASAITAAARLMLALLEHAVITAGGSYAFCDTDAIAITHTQPGQHQHPALGRDVIARILARFTSLNPYDPEVLPGSPWQVKHGSLEAPVLCYAISAKRYALYRLDQSGNPVLLDVIDQLESDTPQGDDQSVQEGLVDWSEHGLGLYLDPTSTDHDHSPRDSKGRRVWVREAWEWILQQAHGLDPQLPTWTSRYAITRFAVTGPRTEAWFRGYNQTVSEEARIRPGCFGLIAHPEPAIPTQKQPTAEYEPDPDRWPTTAWYDRATAEAVEIFSVNAVDADTLAANLDHGAVAVQTFQGLLTRYRLRAEPKSLTHDGSPAGRDATGQLTRRPVESRRILQDLTGKEANNLLERLTGELTQPSEYRTDYATRHGDRWQLTIETIRSGNINITHLAEMSGVDRRTIQRATRFEKPTRPHPDTRRALTKAAAKLAGDILTTAAQPVPRTAEPTLVRYLEWATRTGSDGSVSRF